MLNKPDIQDLLDRYWEGETTLEEERRLKAFFSTEPVPEQYRQEAELFRALRTEQSVQMPAGREMRIAPRPSYRLSWWAAAASVALLLSAGIWWMNRQPLAPDAPVALVAPENKMAQPTATTPAVTAPEMEKIAQTPLPSTPEVSGQAIHRPPSTVHPRGVGAGCPPSTVHRPPSTVHRPPSTVNQDTYEDPEQALEEIKAALALVSNKINKGKKEIGKGLQEVEAVDILFKKKKETSG
ncbi:MAG: hypothetical protein L6Q97_14915 [Thermoanaerobaculia bacterium]|nr:hypothetical protein [Thermoanaerobaculia bacterium]